MSVYDFDLLIFLFPCITQILIYSDLENLHLEELNNANNESHLPLSRSGFLTESNTNYYSKYKPIRRTHHRSNNYSYPHYHRNGLSPSNTNNSNSTSSPVNGNGYHHHNSSSPETMEPYTNHSKLNGSLSSCSSPPYENGHSHTHPDHSKLLDCQCCYSSPVSSSDYGSSAYYVYVSFSFYYFLNFRNVKDEVCACLQLFQNLLFI